MQVNVNTDHFSREEEQFHFSLQDFKCVAVLGRGHFGKVRFILSSNIERLIDNEISLLQPCIVHDWLFCLKK